MGNEMREGRYWKEEKDVQCGGGLNGMGACLGRV